ncbi:MAG: acyl-CoA dehydrogenase family protein [Candidatus Eremiobacteraeota bacterium]|nr:acyl-CoA dehydrogenase family protein [Candidatus Eremiobacteraeota bacterium]MBV9055767.1 acyl-CoA dehydrogenase family protein [Candidatus Eremiobacteraeota bacterium]MBV9699147.1 acyl-CoA dehydrogenase family protein [Candidatus Eremiobacteraeota bacterium]
MNFDLTDEQKAIASLAREFAQEEVRPRAEAMDREERFPYELVEKMAALGFMGLPFPEEYGGAGADTVSYALTVMEIARADASTAITLAAHVSLGATPFFLFGSEAQKQQYLVPMARGEMLWGFGLTEPNAGSDAGNVQTRAELRDGQWVVNGTKAFITNSGTDISGGTTITAVTGRRADGSREISNIIVPQGTPGFSRSRKYRKMGWRASDTRELSFVDAAVPEENLLGKRGEGYRQFLETLDGGRISVAALSIGLALGAYDEALAYSKERQAFGKPISKFQAISFKLVDMLTQIEHAKLMMLRAAWEKDQGRDYVAAASFAKLFAGELSHRVVNEALQIHGGYGFMDEYPISRMYRDQKINEIGEGTNEVQRMILARLIGL